MEAFAIIGLVGNVVQFVDFSGKLIAKSTELYQSNEGALAENIDTEIATNHLVLLNNKLKDAATTTSDDALKRLCESCKSTADELLAALNKVRVNGKQNRWKTIRKALRSVWSKEKIRELEGRLARFREELNLHVVVDLREQVSRLKLDYTDRLKNLDLTTHGVLDAIIKQQDVFKAVHDTQVALMGTLHSGTALRVKDEHATTRREIIGETASNTQAEHAITRREIIQEIRRREQATCLAIPRKSCWSVPLPRNYNFVGRSSQLDRLEASLFRENHSSKVAVTGLGGVGKTQVALELVYRTRDKRPECSVFWVSATNTENVQRAYLRIAQQLRIPGLEDKKEDVRGLVQYYLSQESAGQWLLVLDNADDLDMWLKKPNSSTKSTRLIDSLPRSDRGLIVFTTRSRKAASRFAYGNVIHVAEMDEEAAAQVLRNSLINRKVLDDRPTMARLLRLLTFLPLAIVQAAAYINENDISLAEYVSLFDDHEENIIKVLSEEFEDEGRYYDLKNPIATAWLISFEQIRVRDSLAADYLSFMSCVDPKAVPLSLLPPAQTEKEVIDALGTLSAYSFITKRPADQSFDLHRLVHLVTRNWLREQKLLSEWTAKAIARLAEVFPDNDCKNRSVWRSYLPHAHYVQASNIFQNNIEENLPWIERFGLCLLRDGRWEEAEMALMQVMETRKRVFGEEHPYTLASIDNLASTYRNQGRWKEAEELWVQVIETSARVLGSEHPDILISMAGLASTYTYQGRWKEAEELELQVIETSSRVLGAEHPNTLVAMNSLAAIYMDQGRWRKAEALGVQVMEIRKRVLGRAHFSTLVTISNLGSVYWYQGRWKESEALRMELVQIRECMLGQEHPDTLVAMDNLASTYRDQGRLREAEELGMQVLEMRKRVLGQEHFSTLTTMSNLASTYRSQGRWKEAEVLASQAMKTRISLLGQEHPSTLTTMNILSLTYRGQGRWKEAEILGKQVMEIRKRVLGLEHPDTLTSMNNLALTLQSQSRNKEALSMMKHCFKLRNQVLGSQHPHTEESLEVLNGWKTGNMNIGL